jgi:MFS family permease
MSAMQNAGRLFAPALGGVLAGFWDIRAPFVAYGILSLLAIIPSFKLVQESAPHLTKSAGARQARADATQVASIRALLTYQVVIFFVAQFFASLSRGPIFTGQLNFYGAYVYDLSPQTIGILATAVAAIGIPITIAAGYVMDRYGRKASLVPGFTLLALALAFLGFTDYLSSSLGIFILAYVCVFTSNGITGGNMQTLGSDIAPEKARGKFYGVWQTITTVGAPGGTTMFAVLSGGMGYWVAFGFLGIAAGATAFILGTQVQEQWRRKPATTATSPN